MKMKQLARHSVLALCGLVIAATAQAQVNERLFRFTTANPVGHPLVTGAEKWAELVKEKSGGKMTIKLFPGGVLGGDVQILSTLQGGSLDFASMNTGYLQAIVKEFGLVDLPFMFNNGKEADAILDGPIGKQMAAKLPEKGLINLAYWELGFRNVTNSKRLIRTMEDIAGLKIRVIQNPLYIDTFNALGANAVPMPIGEVYTSMEQKLIDGHENPFSVIEVNKFYEVQPYLAVTNHIYNPQSLLVSKKTWDKLTKDEQDILASTAIEAGKYQRQVSREVVNKAFESLKTKMQVSELPPAEIEKIRAKLKPVVDKYAALVGTELMTQLKSELEKIRKK